MSKYIQVMLFVILGKSSFKYAYAICRFRDGRVEMIFKLFR